MNRIVKRSDKLTFYGVVDGNGNTTFYRMKGFSEISVKKNSREYTRQYVDEEFEQSDVVGYSPSISYAFDQFKDDPVHSDMVSLSEQEKVGDEAVRAIMQVDLSQKNEDGTCPAIKREFAVIFDSEGNSLESYSYSGTLRVKGEKVFGTAVSDDDWTTCSFHEN